MNSQETWGQSLGWEDPLEKEMATHSSILTREIPWTEESGRLQSMGSQRVRHDWATNTFTFSLFFKKRKTPHLQCHPWNKFVFHTVHIRHVNLNKNINIVFCFRIILRKCPSTVNYYVLIFDPFIQLPITLSYKWLLFYGWSLFFFNL